ncbi:protein ECERIFERUM 26-like [Punica granatum]|uniref:Protein ECERIFERUM 26-like n=1 Tax=Punica granatum TaxID=22663 RepID=A0A6P8BUA7_PUNGR|nr:protein ECERIFERUM 26-like [Punica granatum]
MAEVNYICKRTVVSTKPVQPGKSHPLSVLDRLVEPSRHVMVVYYYRTDRSRERLGEVTQKLREGLAEVLTYFPPVTGRLVRTESRGSGEGGWSVKCNDAGVRMVEARAKGSVEDWLRNVDWEKEKRLIHWEEMYHKPYFWSTFYVQLTEFEGGGYAIGLSCSHLLSDPICATVLIKAWADVTLRGKMTSPPLFHQLPAHRPGSRTPNKDPFINLCSQRPTSTNQSATSSASVHGKHKTISLSFSDQMVRSCVASAQAHAGGPSPSPFEALAGLIWAVVSKIKGRRDGLVGLTMGLDIRKLLGLDDGFFGNCMVYSQIQPNSEENCLLAAAMAIREEKAKFEKEKVMDLIEWLEDNDGSKPTQQTLACSDLLCLNLESIDPRWAIFEDGSSPIQTSLYIEPTCDRGQFLVLPSPSEDGPLSRTVMIKLPRDEADKLLEDDLILQFAPTVLMGV